jgi:hypothetical protein
MFSWTLRIFTNLPIVKIMEVQKAKSLIQNVACAADAGEGDALACPHADAKDKRAQDQQAGMEDPSSSKQRQRCPRPSSSVRYGFDLSSIEPFVKPEVVAWYLDIDPATVVRFASEGRIPGHPLRDKGKRAHWRFLLSEIRECMTSQPGAENRSNVRK